MADRTIGSLPRAPDLYDDSLLVVEQQGAAASLSGEQVKRFARVGVADYVDAAQKAAQAAQEAVKGVGTAVADAQSARDAAQAARKGAETARKAVEELEVESDTLAAGAAATVEKTARDGHVLLRFGLPTGPRGPQGEAGASIAGISRTAGNGAAGTTDTYTVSLSDGGSYDFYVYNGADGMGAGDMTAAVYDPQGRREDVFAYVDRKVPEAAKAITAEEIDAAWAGFEI